MPHLWDVVPDHRHKAHKILRRAGSGRQARAHLPSGWQSPGKRERADDHPLKKIYERRTNTIIQKLHRGTIDEKTAAVMKRLAKNKLERAIADREYAAGPYEAEMTHEALLAEAQNYLK